LPLELLERLEPLEPFIRWAQRKISQRTKGFEVDFLQLSGGIRFRIDVSPSGIVFTFLPNQKNAKSQCDEQKGVAAVDRRKGRR
jgi:hypothetical protein